MRITIDISACPYGTGVSLYTANLLRALIEMKSPHRLGIFAGSLRQLSALSRFAQTLNIDRRYLYPIPPKLNTLLFNYLNIPIDPFIGQSDVFHSWDWYLPGSIRTGIVLTVHDLALFKFPQTAHRHIRRNHTRTLTKAVNDNTHLIAVSQTTKQDLIDIFHLPPQNITVIYEALPQEHRLKPTSQDIKRTLTAHGLSRPYLLIVSTLEPRKNIPRMIHAWESYHQDFDLVIVGKSGWQEIDHRSGLHLLGFISPLELASLYRGASCLLYASLYEGFGLPILEAFHHQLPVLTSNLSATQEIAADAAVLVNPFDVADIRRGIDRALSLSPQLVKKGNRRLAQFSWAQTARDTLQVYRSVGEGLS